MLRIEISVSGWRKEEFERELRKKMLLMVYDTAGRYPSTDINRVQFIKPKH